MTLEYESVKLNFGPVLKTKRKNATWIDIETKKVFTPAGFLMDTGEPMRRRWEPIAIGVGFIFEGDFWVECTCNWSSWAVWTSSLREYADVMVYHATREFDEMVLKGRFTNARRAHLMRPGPWPHIGANDFDWVNIKKVSRGIRDRGVDVPSKYVPDIWPTDPDRVLVHLIRDIMLLAENDPENKITRTKNWTRSIFDYEYLKEKLTD